MDDLQLQRDVQNFRLVGQGGRVVDHHLSRDQLQELQRRIGSNVNDGLIEPEQFVVEEYDGETLLDSSPWSSQ